jgi:hypothetical protein
MVLAMSTDSTAKPSERLPNETTKQYEAFVEYLTLDGKRSLEAVGRRLGKSKVLLERWSAANHWVERVAAHEALKAEKRLVRREKLDLDAEIEAYRKAVLEDSIRLRQVAREYFEIGVAAMQRLSASEELKPNEVGLILSRSTAMMQQSGELAAVALGVSEIAAGLDSGSASGGGGEGPPETAEGVETVPALAESEAAPKDEA